MTVLAAAAAILWLAILLLPWRPWRADLALDAKPSQSPLGNVTALIPARNEAPVLPETLAALKAQGGALAIVVVDDQSSDATAEVARSRGAHVIAGAPVPSGWTGKVWALEQGRALLASEYVLLLDADIALAPGTVAALLGKVQREGLAFASLVPQPRFEGFWEKLLMPAFVYFFALLYPFRLSNAPASRITAASGGCVLAERRVLDAIGGFGALKGALIDDCALAACVKRAGFRTWIGLTHSARSLRPYPRLADIRSMVERTAYTQLRYSPLWLALCTAALALAFWIPVVAIAAPDVWVRTYGVAAFAGMFASYVPTLRYYGRSSGWGFALPVIGTLYLAMTWCSALRYYRCERARWKDRVYVRESTG